MPLGFISVPVFIESVMRGRSGLYGRAINKFNNDNYYYYVIMLW